MKMMKRFASLIVSCIGFLLLCSCSIQTTPSLLTSTSSVVDVNAKILDEVPFAYDLVVDTISYNSCVGRGLNSSGRLHGLKLGASEGFVDSTGSGAVKSGLKLKSDFLSYVAQNVDPTFPNTSVMPSQIQYILENSEKNKDLQIQFAIRDRANLRVVQDVIDPSKAIGQYDPTRDGVYEAAVLSQNPVLNNLVSQVQFGPNKTIISEGTRVYNLGYSSAPDPIQGSLGYSANEDATYPAQAGFDDGSGAGEEYSNQVRENFNQLKYVLAVTFGNQTRTVSGDTTNSFGLNAPAKAKGAAANRAYGRSFELNFASKRQGVKGHLSNVLNTVTDKDLSTGSSAAGASWSCENFVIMKSSEWNNKKASQPSCTEFKAADLNLVTNGKGAILRAKIAKIRRHYPESDWGIGFFTKANQPYNLSALARSDLPICLVNKAVDCYMKTKGLILTEPDTDVGVNYSVLFNEAPEECYLSRFTQMGVTYTGNKSGDEARRLGRCPQYASICVRTSTSF